MQHDVEKTVLKLGEWLAENAYISPGKHRLMTAGGLLLGLTGGRQLMNVLTGHDGKGNPIDAASLPPPLQRFHGMYDYNRFEDDASTKWHKVADSFVPFVIGGLGAMAGSAAFARATPMAKGLNKALAQGADGYYLQHADMLANKVQARKLNFLSGLGLNMGSTSGVHLFPTMMASSTSAFRFQIDHGKNIILPGLKQLTQNRGHSSRNMFITMDDFIGFVKSNAAHYTGKEWYFNETRPIINYAKDMMQVFKEATPEQRKLVEGRIQEMCEAADKLAQQVSKETGYTGDALVSELDKQGTLNKQLGEFLTKGLEDSFIDAKLINPNKKDLSNIAAGDYGVVSDTTYLLGGRNKSKGHVDNWFKSMQKRRGIDANPVNPFTQKPKETTPWLAGMTGVAGLLGLTAIFGNKRADEITDQDVTIAPDLPRHEQARVWHNEQSANRDKNVMSMANGKALDWMSWASTLTVVPPGLHRFMNAAFLSGFLYGGAKISCALAGRDLKGAALAAEQIWPVLRPLHGKMSYVWKSGERSERWKHVAHQLMPVTIGAFGTYAGSRMYFEDTIERTKQAEYLEDYTDRVLMEESESYARASAVTSILNTGSGFHLLPIISYPANLQNRFLFARGQQIATPGVGKWWSGNPSKYPWHIRRLLVGMTEYAVNNTSEFPVEFDDMTHALVAKLYPDLPAEEINEKRDILVEKLYEIRDRYWQPGGIPEDSKDLCRQEIEQHFRREGLERTLIEAGLDPMKAALDNNGAGGAFARWMGSGHTVSNTIDEYHDKLDKRLKRITPDTQIQEPVIHGTQDPGLALTH